MVTTIKNDGDKQGRNELCDCGSGKKHKKCCGLAYPEITLRDMMKCFYLLLEGVSKENVALPKGPIPFSKKMLADVPKDFVQRVTMVQDGKYLVLSVKREKTPLIVVPNQRIVR